MIWKKKEEWPQLNIREVVDLVSFLPTLPLWKVESFPKKENTLEKFKSYKNNFLLIVKKVKNSINMDVMVVLQLMLLYSMKKLEWWRDTQSNIKLKKVNAKSTEM